VHTWYVFGPILVAWVVVLVILGLTRENFPASPRAERIAGAISVILVLLAIASAVYQGATEEDKESGGEGAALVP
jgi:formate-dependent nitrite reductase membrane component NrfD